MHLPTDAPPFSEKNPFAKLLNTVTITICQHSLPFAKLLNTVTISVYGVSIQTVLTIELYKLY
jgi:hypothetical protein